MDEFGELQINDVEVNSPTTSKILSKNATDDEQDNGMAEKDKSKTTDKIKDYEIKGKDGKIIGKGKPLREIGEKEVKPVY